MRNVHAGIDRHLREAPAVGSFHRQRRHQVDPRKALERFRHRDPLGRGEWICRAVSEAELPRARGLCSGRYHRHAIVHEQLVGAVRPVPFEHGKFRVVQRAALTIAIAAGELEDPLLASRQKLLAGEFRRGPQIALVPARGRGQLGPHRVDMGLVARRHLQRRGLDLHEFQRREQVTHGPGDFAPQDQERAALGMGVRSPKTGAVGHQKTPRIGENRWRSDAGSVCCAPM